MLQYGVKFWQLHPIEKNGRGVVVLLVTDGEEIVNPKERVYEAFDEPVFLHDLVTRVRLPLPVVWDAVLELEREGKVTYFAWHGKTVILKRR